METILPNREVLEKVLLAPAPKQIKGSLKLDFENDVRSGVTILAASVQEPPLRIVRPFPLEDGSVLVHLHNVSGGVLGGDVLHMSVSVGPGASVQLTTTGATRVYRARQNRPTTTQINRFIVAKNALLEYVPDPVIPFANCRFRQETSIHLDRGAGLFWWEILAPGRSARGELFEYECLEFKTDVMAEGRHIAVENARLEPSLRELSSLVRLGPYRYWVTFYIARIGLDSGAWLRAEEKLREVVRRFDCPGESLWGVSTLAADGLVVRGLTVRGQGILAALRIIWSAAKLLLYGREAILPRKVN
jgi:urease accessory protein